MHSKACDALRKQGYLFFSPDSSAAVKPCMWSKRALRGGDMCYKHQFYGIESHRCIQMTPTLRCNQRCLFCWRSMENEVVHEIELTPDEIVSGVRKLHKKGLAGYKPHKDVTAERWSTATETPNQVAISLSGEPTCYSQLPQLVDLFKENGYTVFVVSNGTRPWVVQRLYPTQMYLSLDAPDEETYTMLCRPKGDYWERIQESLSYLSSRRSAIRMTLVKGLNDHSPEKYARIIADAAPTFVEVKGYMYLGYSRSRLSMEQMPDHAYVRSFAEKVARLSGYRIRDESPVSRVVCLEEEL
ncbi:MAG: 4-demethylwyosine synthase TYW1 [Methanocalculus sp.]|uniref:4-demethylwyosine synthase TYW1 n=1 Tax=Methanocalculus sp. TaxID=2004547 RepID=UPI00271CC20E|nr:4-demethylwyosine synthase TYW1 [Methanocalculus sp.]MDO9539628.1 4-demethylwyosine synthase TYW1 [Methanocalculus sp.]